MPLHLVLLIVAVVLFAIATFASYWPSPAPRLNLIAAGLTFLAASFWPG